ncbi:MAG: hypothetical protein GC186_16635 [Rhodobacteraceae bacterium]|nr:hypothetical protein [Paracoccaceae bacterium]
MIKSAQRKISAYLGTQEAEQAVRQASDRLGWDRPTIHRGGLATAARLAGKAGSRQTIIAELGDMNSQDAAESLRALAANSTQVIVLGERNDVGLYRQMLAAGAQDYLVMPIGSDDLAGVMSRRVAGAPEPTAVAKVIGVTSIRGGGGASFVAANLAWLFAARMGRQTVLLDLDLGFGTQAVDFDVQPTGGLIEALLNPDRIDETYLSATLAQVGEKLRLYSAEGPLDRDGRDLTGRTPQLVAQLATAAQVVVLDLPRDLAVDEPQTISACGDLIVLLSPAISVARSYARFRQWMAEIAPDTRLRPVLSMNRNDARLSRKEIEAALGEPVAAMIPNVAAAFARAAVAGKPLAALQPRNPAIVPLQALARSIGGEEPRRRGFFGRGRG